MKINKSIIKIVGLLGDFNKKNTQQQYQEFINSGYSRDVIPTRDLTEKQEASKRFLKNTFYPEFRDMMFLGQTDSQEKRFSKVQTFNVELYYGLKPYVINIVKSEIYVFEGQIGLFSVSIEIDPSTSVDTSEDIDQKATKISI